MNVEELTAQIENLFPGVEFYVSENDLKIEVHSLRVPPNKQNQGWGSAILQMVKDYAKQVQKPVILSPEADRGKKGALERFYKKNGFIYNRGRNKDYRFGGIGAGPLMKWTGFREWIYNQENGGRI